MTLTCRLLRTRPVRTILVVLALVLAWQLYLAIAAPGKIDDELAAQVDEGEPVRVGVVLDFPPERFHTLYLQDYGRILRVEGNEIQLRSVRPESVAMLARVYWVESLVPLEESS
ncbi:hypothetical protein [Georgenia sp. Z1491]|uniref:hypothetical protein n=1 Tax=Georgenia sp. Z1491 TaxID=3416707 RepID=UPI003CE796D1